MDSPEEDESGFSEAEGNKRETSVKNQELNDNRRMFAAIRLFVGKGNVNINSVDKIKEFDQSKRHFPYNAYIANEFDENDEIIYKPGSILAISHDENELKNRSTRWPKPNIRRSTVIHQLAKDALKKEKDNAKKNKKMANNTSKKVQAVLPLEQEDHSVKMKAAQQRMKRKITILNKKKLKFNLEKKFSSAESTSEDETNKDKLIARLTRELEEERRKKVSAVIPTVTTDETPTKRFPFSPVNSRRKLEKKEQNENDSENLSLSPSLVSEKRKKTGSTSGMPAFIQNENDSDNSSSSPSLVSEKRKKTGLTGMPAFTQNENDSDNLSSSPSLVSGKPDKKTDSTRIPAFIQNENDSDNLSSSPSLVSRKRKKTGSTSGMPAPSLLCYLRARHLPALR